MSDAAAIGTAGVNRMYLLQAEQAQSRVPLSLLNTRCSTCHLRGLCLLCAMSGGELTGLDSLMFGRHRVKAGQAIYYQGDSLQFIYAVRGGTCKTSLTLTDGREQVSGFHMTGELLGLDAVAQGTHGNTAHALEDTELCTIAFEQLSELAAANAGIQLLLAQLMSREIVREHSLMILLGSMNANQRLAAFLLNLSQRYAARGYSAREFHLRMSRAEIASYLGMKVETVSRTFTAFQQRNLLAVNKRHIGITDMEGLSRAFELPMG